MYIIAKVKRILPFTKAEVGVEVGYSLEVVREHDGAEHFFFILDTLAHFETDLVMSVLQHKVDKIDTENRIDILKYCYFLSTLLHN